MSGLDPAQAPADGEVSADGLVTKSMTEGTLPTDPYRAVDRRIYNYAWDIHMALCMAKSDYSYPVVTFDWNDPSNEPYTGFNRPTTVEEAGRYGYHLNPDDGDPGVRDASAFLSARPADYQATLSSCMDDTAADPMFVDAVEDIGYGDQRIRSNPAVTDAMTQWRSCMAPLGIPDLPEDHPGIAPSLSSELGLDQPDTNTLTDLSTITQRELTVAVQDAQCRESSGYDRTVYDLTWMGEQQLLTDNASEFTARKELIDTQTQEMTDYIETNRGQV